MYEKLKNYNNLYSKQERKELIARNLIIFRQNEGLQQKEVAELINIQYQTYRNYENAQSEPPAEILVRLSKLYEVPVDIIIGSDDYGKDKETNKKIVEGLEQEIIELRTKLENEKNEVKKIALNGLLNAAEIELKRIKKTLK